MTKQISDTLGMASRRSVLRGSLLAAGAAAQAGEADQSANNAAIARNRLAQRESIFMMYKCY